MTCRMPGEPDGRQEVAAGFVGPCCSVALALGLLAEFPARAQAAEGAGLEVRDAGDAEIATLPTVTVTVDKTAKRLEDVPASVKVLDGEDLEQAGIGSFEQLAARIPGLSFQPFGQSGINSPVLRGLTANLNTLSTSTLLLVDDVPTLTAQGFENRFIDIDRVEVLRGPQSALYGRNAEAGVIALYSRPMDPQPRTSLSAELGSRHKQATRVALSRPLVENQLYASLSGEWLRQDGFIRNVYSGGLADDRTRYNLNLGLRWTPQASTDFVLRYATQHYDDGAAWWGSPNTPRYQVASGTPSWNRAFGQTFSLNASHDISSGLRWRAITAINDFNDRAQQDSDFLPAPISLLRRDNHLHTLSQEFRLEGHFGDLDWLVGLYGDRSDNDLHALATQPMAISDLAAKQKSDTLALFSHANIPLTPAWSLAVGARLERYGVSLDPVGAAGQQAVWTQVSPKLALQYAFRMGNQIYASASKGVRNGGFNVLAPVVNYRAFEPETVWSYEVGVKGVLPGKALRYALAAYVMDVKRMQVMQMPAPGLIYITNAASATSKGVDFDLDYVLGGGWLLQTGWAWNQARFARFRDGAANYDGKRNPFAPDFNGQLGVRYDAPGGWYGQVQLVGSGKAFLDPANRYVRHGYGLVNLTGGVTRDTAKNNWELSAYVNNLANRRVDAVGYQNGFVTVYSPPREVGIRLTWRR